MPLRLKTYQCGTPRKEGESLRVGVVRYPPRGVKKEDYARMDYFDVWFPSVAPSREIISRFRKSKGARKDWDEFIRHYLKEMEKSESRQAIALLSEVAKRTPVAIGCYCADEKTCHRSVLKKLIEQAAGTIAD